MIFYYRSSYLYLLGWMYCAYLIKQTKNIMKKFTSTLILVLLVSALSAQNIAGDWYGTLNIQGNKLHLVFHIIKTAETYTSTMDSPDQNAFGLATDNTTFSNNQLTIEAAKFGLKYTGTFKADSNIIKGTFTQGPANLPLTLSHNKPTAAIAPAIRPQDPKDFPYKQEEVYFINPKQGNPTDLLRACLNFIQLRTMLLLPPKYHLNPCTFFESV